MLIFVNSLKNSESLLLTAAIGKDMISRVHE